MQTILPAGNRISPNVSTPKAERISTNGEGHGLAYVAVCVQNSQAQCNPFFAILPFVVDVDFYAESRVAFTLSAPYN
jgi:hypothetical protein